MEKPKKLHAQLMDMNQWQGLLEGKGVLGGGGQRGKNRDNLRYWGNSLINKIYLKKESLALGIIYFFTFII